MKWVLTVTLIATIFRLFVFLDFGSGCCGSDEGIYHSMAVNFIKYGEMFVTRDDEPRIWNDIVYGAKPPFYPFFLASVYKFLGPNYNAVRVIQIFLSAVTGLLVYIITKELSSERIGMAALLTYSFFLEGAFVNITVLSESVYWLLLMILTYLLIMIKKYNKRFEIITGIVLGLLVLTRPTAILFFLPVLIWFLWGRMKISNLFKVAIIAIFCFITIAPWVVRNFNIYKQFVFIYTDGGINFWMGNHEGTGGTYRVPKPNDPTHTPTLTSIGPQRELERDRFYYNQAYTYILNNKLKAFDVAWRKLFGTFALHRQAILNYTRAKGEILPFRLRSDSIAVNSFLEFVVSYQFSIFMISSFIGWIYFVVLKNFNSTFMLLTGLISIHIFSIILTHYEFRYVEQMYPLMMPFAASFLTLLWQMFDKNNLKNNRNLFSPKS